MEFQNYQKFQYQNIFINKMLVDQVNQRIGDGQHNLCQIGNYKYSLTDMLGEGFSSKVYKGLNSATQQQVAIKIINTDILIEPINATLLQFQLQILQKMKGCFGVLELHEIIKKGKDTYIITEICQTDLSKLLTPMLPLQNIQVYIWQLIQGFNQFYRKQIIHRDLKPANLLIDKYGNLKIGDLGFAIKCSQARKQLKFNIGSPLYMAPQALKRNQYTHKSDIWALGVIVYEMLTGDTPWKAQNQQQLYQNYQRIRIQQILLHQRFPEHINSFLMKTLQFQRRYRISPQQLMLLNISNKAKAKNNDTNQVNMEQIEKNNYLYIPRQNKTTKTQKFHKQLSNYSILNKTTKSPKDQPVPVTVRTATRRTLPRTRPQLMQPSKQIVKQCAQIPTATQISQNKQQQKSCTTNGSTSVTLNQKGQKMSKQQIKDLTKCLIYYIHICRLLYKIIVRINQCIQNSANQIIKQTLETERDNIHRLYCNIIVKHMHEVKNFANNNFLEIQKNHADEYIMSSEYKKLKKVCTQYIQRYSKSEQLKFLWPKIQNVDYDSSIQVTIAIVSKIWPELCQKNQNQIILLQFLNFAVQALQALKTKDLNTINAKNKIQDYVDTIPNPPSVNRFKQAIAKAKNITIKFAQKTKEKLSQ